MKKAPIVINTRFEIKQTGPTSFEVLTGPFRLDLISINPAAIDELKLTDKEIEKAITSAEDAVIKELIIAP